ncbi:MAG: response regulator [Acidobacteriota bacterium]
MTDRDQSRSKLPPATILLVEDEEVVRDFLSSILELDGHSVEAVPHGGAALAFLSRHDVDLVLADCLMPVMDGCQLHSVLRQRHDPLADRMVLISGDMERDPVRTYLRKHSVVTLQKPFGAAELRAVLARVIAR